MSPPWQRRIPHVRRQGTHIRQRRRRRRGLHVLPSRGARPQRRPRRRRRRSRRQRRHTGRPGRLVADRLPFQAPLQGRARHARQGLAHARRRRRGHDLEGARGHGSPRVLRGNEGNGRAHRRPHARRRAHHRGARRRRRPRKRALRHVHAPRPRVRRVGRAFAGAVGRARDEAHGRRGACGHAFCGEIFAHLEDLGGTAEDRRLPVHDACPEFGRGDEW